MKSVIYITIHNVNNNNNYVKYYLLANCILIYKSIDIIEYQIYIYYIMFYLPSKIFCLKHISNANDVTSYKPNSDD